eukprot:CAMPEP_0172490534 /NCGR_PEP_ID=MMETSP1066-20121228/20996_1 /TAXON_ID=671091 /ORGANISM="Coscinodiscus wailesii, Strain CCMP2513" /LENGTH=521 /DNA_ID=CAMNT_0013259045 /DNA_START=97 /DNA_END=1659 /DNA_ORIENTATION=-
MTRTSLVYAALLLSHPSIVNVDAHSTHSASDNVDVYFSTELNNLIRQNETTIKDEIHQTTDMSMKNSDWFSLTPIRISPASQERRQMADASAVITSWNFGTGQNTPTAAPTFMQPNDMLISIQGDNASFGNMFDVVAVRRLTITSFDIHTDAYTQNDGHVEVEVWTRSGSFVGHHLTSKGWRLIASCRVQAAGVGQYTRIPQSEFMEVKLEPNDRQAFFVVLKSADLRYSKVTDTEVGRVFESNAHLEFLVGVAIGQDTFGDKIFDNRLWNGKIHYTIGERPRPEVTEVLYKFSIEHTEGLANVQITDSIDNFVRTALEDIFNEGVKGLVKTNQLVLENVESSIHLKQKNNVLTCDLDEAGMVCSIVFTTVKVTHTNTISKALVRHKLLMLSKNLLNGMLYKSKYIGPEALETGTIIELTGVEMVNLTPDNRHVFEDTLKVFLNHTLANVDPPVQITTVSAEARDIKINSRSIMNKPGTRLRHHDNLRRLYSDPTATVELYTTITGEYQPPPEVKFDIVVT